jgi:hypothetical protein
MPPRHSYNWAVTPREPALKYCRITASTNRTPRAVSHGPTARDSSEMTEDSRRSSKVDARSANGFAPGEPYVGPSDADRERVLAELTERARAISEDATTRIATAMREVLAASTGVAGFALGSARDLAHFMVRRGQMSQEDSDRLIHEAEEAFARRSAHSVRGVPEPAGKGAKARTPVASKAKRRVPTPAKKSPAKKSSR